MDTNKISKILFLKFLSEKNKSRIERAFLRVAIISFMLHLLIIGLINFDVISVEDPSYLLKNPIAAIYTPFSFILIYEVYLLVYYLPKSTSIYVSKQYEIITLIVFRRLFKDLSNLNLTENWFNNKYDLQFTFDLITAIVLFYIIYLFHFQHSKTHETIPPKKENLGRITQFVQIKKWIAIALVPILFFIAIFSFLNWSYGILQASPAEYNSFKNINNIFFEEFFNLLIITDVFLLLFSFFHTDYFHKVIRNSGFIISTILLRVSFSVDGIINNLLIVSAVLFGLLVILIHNKFEKQIAMEEISYRNEIE